MNRRTLLKGTSGFAAGLLLTRSTIAFAQSTPTAGKFPELAITITDDGFTLPDGLTTGRYAVTVTNNGSTPSHCPMGRLPEGVTNDQVLEFMQSGSEELPDWFLNTGYVGLPDWAVPGGSVTGIVDLAAGSYFMFDPFSTRYAFATVAEGNGTKASDPESAATIELKEMEIILPADGLPSGPSRLKIQNVGAMAHELAVLAVPEGTTVEQISVLFTLPDTATPAQDDALGQALMNFQPVAGMSILAKTQTAWIDVDLPPGTYATMCMLPFPDGVFHAMEGMMAVVTIS